jgi:hypothetical protein
VAVTDANNVSKDELTAPGSNRRAGRRRFRRREDTGRAASMVAHHEPVSIR